MLCIDVDPLHTFRTDTAERPRRLSKERTLCKSYNKKSREKKKIFKIYEWNVICGDWWKLTSIDSMSGLRDKIIENSWLPGIFSQNVNTIWLLTAFITWTVPVNWANFICPTSEPVTKYAAFYKAMTAVATLFFFK